MGKLIWIWALVALFAGFLVGKVVGGFGRGQSAVQSVEVIEPEDIEAFPENLFLKEVEAAGISEFHSLLDETYQGDNDLPAALARRELVRKWLKTDPKGMADFVFQDEFDARLRSNLLPLWASIDPENLYAFGISQTGLIEQEAALGSLVEVFPKRILSFLSSQPKLVLRAEYIVISCVAKLAESDPVSAAMYFDQHQSELNLNHRLVGLANWSGPQIRLSDAIACQWVKRDPAGAVAWAKSGEKIDDRKLRLASTIGEWAKIDPAAAGEVYRSLETSPSGLLRATLENLSLKDSVTAIQWADEFGNEDEKGWVIADIILDVREPKDLIDLVDNFRSDEMRDGIVRRLMRNWHSRDLETGFELLRQNADSKEQFHIWLGELAKGVGSSQFDEAMRVSAKEIDDPILRGEFQRQLIIDLAAKDPRRAWREAGENGDDLLFAEVTNKVLSESSIYDKNYSNSQVAFAIDAFPPEISAERGCYTFVNRWYDQSKEGVVDGVLGMTHPLNRKSAIKELARRMANENEEEAIELAERVSGSSERDIVVGQLITYRKREQPERMFQLATGLQAGGDRFLHLSGSLKVLAKRDSTAARKLLGNATGLSERERERLRELIY